MPALVLLVRTTSQSTFAGAAETACTARALREFVDEVETYLDDRHHDKLGDSFHRIQSESYRAAIPQGDQNLSLVIRVDQSDKVAEDDAVLVAHTGARQHHGCQAWVPQVNCDARRNQLSLARLQDDRGIDAGPQIESGGPGSGVGGQLVTQARVQDLDVDVVHRISSCWDSGANGRLGWPIQLCYMAYQLTRLVEFGRTAKPMAAFVVEQYQFIVIGFDR